MDFDSYNGIKKPGPAEKRDVFGYGHDQPAEAVAAAEIAHWSSAAVEIWNGNRHIPHVRPIETSEPAAGDVMVYGGDGRLYWVSREKAVEAMHCGERILPRAQELSEETLENAEVNGEELLAGYPPHVHDWQPVEGSDILKRCDGCDRLMRETDLTCAAPGYNVMLTI